MFPGGGPASVPLVDRILGLCVLFVCLWGVCVCAGEVAQGGELVTAGSDAFFPPSPFMDFKGKDWHRHSRLHQCMLKGYMLLPVKVEYPQGPKRQKKKKKSFDMNLI